ncbi:hypothetical protein EK21DRAFT_69280, partial [Setomelanomma holmii]
PNSHALAQIYPKTSGPVDDAPKSLLGSLKTGRSQPLRHHPARCADLGPGGLHIASRRGPPRREVHDRKSD